MDPDVSVGGGPRVSFLLPTFNRRDVLLHTLDQVMRCGLRAGQFEVIVVDNASTDGSRQAVRERFPSVVLLSESRNRGPCAKNAGLAVARGEFVVFLDDDSYPEPGSVARMIRAFEADRELGAAVFTVTLPDGSRECSAYPDVCIGCGTGFRRSALQRVGGLPEHYFMAAEEYDLSLRLLDDGWRVRLFEDLHVNHLKAPASRFPARVARLDARNNTLLALRYFPDPWRWRYAREWLERYRLMGIANRRRGAFWAGAATGLLQGLLAGAKPMRPAAFEQFAKIAQTQALLQQATERLDLRRVLFVDLGKNMLAYRAAAGRCGLEVVAIADQRLGGRGLKFRGIPILSDAQAASLSFDAAVISNLSPVHAAARAREWAALQTRPVLDLFQAAGAGERSTPCIAARPAA